MNCGTCKVVIDATEDKQCSKCSVGLHMACMQWQDTGLGKTGVCSECFLQKDIEGRKEITPEHQEASLNKDTAEKACSGLDRHFSCVLFPGVVKNVDKAIQYMGGVKGMSQVASHPLKKRLGLTFQPENPYIKKIYADYKKIAGVLLKVKVRKVKENGEVKRQVVSTDVVARVDSIFKFNSLADFQYMPVYRETSGRPMECILDKIVPSGTDTIDFLKGEAPFFIVPSVFTRFDRPVNYAYIDKRYPDTADVDDDIHNKIRTDRGQTVVQRWTFSYTGDFPDKPKELYIKNFEVRCQCNDMLKTEFETIKQCFEKRPIWTLNMLRFQTKIRIASLKTIVPCIAVFMKDGAWRNAWVKYGFDPRKEPSARQYQTLDFRLRHKAGVYTMVMNRDQALGIKSANRVRASRRQFREQPLGEELTEGSVLYRAGVVPTQRQIFYQLCDIDLPEIKAILKANPTRECHQKHGWLPPNAEEECRTALFDAVKQTMLANHNSEVNLDAEGSSDEEAQASGDEITNDLETKMDTIDENIQ